MPNDDTREWLNYAHMDYEVAVFLQGHQPLPIEIICYHCQQAAEKAIKSVLVSGDREVPRIHDLPKLLALASQQQPSLAELFKQANRLTNYAAFTRYPGGIELTEADMQLALRYAWDIIHHIETLLTPKQPQTL